MTEQELNVQHAFSKQSAVFDSEESSNPVLHWMRDRVRSSMLAFLKKQSRILDLNCGTGLDSLFFAEKGLQVTSVDIAPGMLEQLDKKIKKINLEDQVETKLCSYTDLDTLQKGKFNHVFSNFGGLNCTDDLNGVIQKIKEVLLPGGTATLVIMPPICLWELALALKGNFRTAFRRLKKKGAESQLEGVKFKTYYYSPDYVQKAFGKDFRLIHLKGLGIIVPPPHAFKLALKHPGSVKILQKAENLLAGQWPFHSIGDHFIITLKNEYYGS